MWGYCSHAEKKKKKKIKKKKKKKGGGEKKRYANGHNFSLKQSEILLKKLRKPNFLFFLVGLKYLPWHPLPVVKERL